MKEGQHIRFEYGGQTMEGLVIQADENQINLKLDSGYNMQVPLTDLQNIEETEISSEPSKKPEIKQSQTLPKVTILHTGGTIASKVDYSTGAVSNKFSPEEILEMFPEMFDIAQVNSTLIRNMASDDMRFGHYNIIARSVLEEINKQAVGLIITHGTDTLHYTGAALSFALEGINVPVVLVGSQRSSDRGSSDAASNLLGALRFITETKAPGVFIAMHENTDDDSIAIFNGLHARKNHSSRRDAFVSVNAELVARVKDNKVEILDQKRLDDWKSRAEDRPSVIPFNDGLKVGLWKVHPQCWVSELKPYDDFDGLVIEGTGLGHAPITGFDEFTKEQHPFIREKIGQLAETMPVVMTTQTIFGRVNMNVYTPGRKLQELGVLGHGLDMTPETAFIKLAWLLSHHSADDTKGKFSDNIRGEISDRSPLEELHK